MMMASMSTLFPASRASSSSSSSSSLSSTTRSTTGGCRSCCCSSSSSSSSSKNETKEYGGTRASISGVTRRRNDNTNDAFVFVSAAQKRQTLNKCFPRSSSNTTTRAAATTTTTTTTGDMENEDENKKKRKSNKLPTRMVVETAMLAAMTGLSFHLSASFRLETYLGSLFPLPIVVASARWGDIAAWRTLLVAFLLLTLLSGPLRASNYACLHGFTGLALGLCWKRKFSWVQSVPISALARTVGVFSSLAVSSLVIRENVLRLMVQQVYALIDQICATLGATFVPNMTAILCVAFVFVILNSLSYTLILHLVYSIALVTATPDGNFSNAPLKVRRALGLPSAFMQ
jgi:hypothetical protein